ncbi:restriction endonuclease subunit S [Selenomonas sp. KH1T6]|uniref:restriction endonuclease subunit S n=1 Tax=Selenomonas sp. KH1T6 TaxID=3158784 RepID=UPI0008A7F7F5|nr:type I restriction enzyme, S subunit [Selenomonas ruminantium]
MREMKDSGVEWIGEIPKFWDIIKLKYLVSIRSGEAINNDQLIDDGLYPVYGGGEPIGLCNMFNTKASDLLVGRVGARCGCVSYPQNKVWATDNALVVSSNYDTKLLYYILDSMELNRLNTSNAQPLITGAKIKNSFIPFSFDLDEQERITDFFDIKCAEIDSVMNDIQHQIEVLQEYKQSVITEAVTKGLDKNVAIKDSGIKWIGEIPQHWEVKKVKYIGTARNGLTYKPTDIVGENEGILVLRSSNVQEGKLSFDDNVYVSCKIPKELKVKKGDILICSRNGSRELIGKNAIIDDVDASFGAFMMIYRCIAPRFMYYVLNSEVFKYYLGTFFTSTINQLTGSNFDNMKIVFCPNEGERKKIVEYLDVKCAEIDSILSDKQKQLDTLAEYKKSLIYEYVTGKKEVPVDA